MAFTLELTVVVTYVRPVEDQASPNSSVDGEELLAVDSYWKRESFLGWEWPPVSCPCSSI